MMNRNSLSTRRWICALSFAAVLFFLPGAASALTLTFDDMSGLGDAPEGITFSSGAYIWRTPGHTSVLSNPLGTYYSTEDTLCITASCIGAGDIYFDFEIDAFSIVALSGPGVDLLGSGVQIEAFDAAGNSLGVDVAEALQFDVLAISAEGIRRIRLTSTSAVEVWDDMSYETAHTPEPSTAILLGAGLMAIASRTAADARGGHKPTGSPALREPSIALGSACRIEVSATRSPSRTPFISNFGEIPRTSPAIRAILATLVGIALPTLIDPGRRVRTGPLRARGQHRLGEGARHVALQLGDLSLRVGCKTTGSPFATRATMSGTILPSCFGP